MAQITLRDYLQETEDAISSKRVDEALASCQYILAYFPESLEAQRLLGEVYLAQGRFEDARNAFDWVLTNDPENVIAYCSRAKVSERMSDYDTALDCYQQAYELSRGNSQIRQAFNELSEKAGQPGFMFSRAGLARLYMRGSLLSQAILEWDIVLSMTPDRLDARTGLLETYWRQGLYDRASQLADQILQDVPGCVKALLLLSHVTAPQDMLRSRDLIQRVSSLDPDLQMAHDLFADHIVNNTGDPFLKLLDRPAATLGEPDKAIPAATTAAASTQSENVFGDPFGRSSSSSSVPSSAPEQLSGWSGSENWQSESTLVKPRSDKDTPVQPAAQVDAPAMPSWMSDDAFQNRYSGSAAASPDAGTRSNAGLTPSQSGLNDRSQAGSSPQPGLGEIRGSGAHWSGTAWEATGQTEQTGPASVQNTDDQAEPWQLLQNALNGISPDATKQPSDHGIRQDSGADMPSISSWTGDPFSSPQSPTPMNGSNWNLPAHPDEQPQQDTASEQQQEHPWMQAVQDTNNAAPPAWLSMLTKPEHDQLHTSAEPGMVSETRESAEPARPVSPLPEPAPQRQPQQPEPATAEPESAPTVPDQSNDESEELPDWAQMMQSEEGDSEDEDSFFGPAWLRSLGAMDESGAEAQAIEEPQSPTPVMQEAQSEAQNPRLENEPAQPDQSFASPAAPTAGTSFEAPQAQSQEPATESNQQPGGFGSSWSEWQSIQMQQQASSPTTAWWQETQGQYDPFGSINQASKPGSSTEYDPFARQEPGEQQTAYVPQDHGAREDNLNDTWSSQIDSLASQTSSWHGDSANNHQSNTYAAEQPEQFNAAEQPPADFSLPQESLHEAIEEDPWTRLSQQMHDKSIDYSWLEQIASGQASENASSEREQPPVAEEAQPAAPSQEAPEQHVIATLEELDQRLRSRGFIPLEPNSLASIAQSEDSEEHTSAAEPQEPQYTPAAEPQARPTLSSAFAELSGDYSQQSSRPAEEVAQPPEEPSWLTALGFGMGSGADEPQTSYTESEPVAYEQRAKPELEQQRAEVAATPAGQDAGMQDEAFLSAFRQQPSPQPIEQQPTAPAKPAIAVPPTPVVPAPAVPFEPAAESQTQERTPAPAPVARVNPLLDSELETTMKRPAVRLQPMKQRVTGQDLNLSPAYAKIRGGEHSSQSDEGNVSYRERLIHGYQAQLVGDYDSAMQEYRIIIRSAPELLGDVVSNVRALLKLAPKYSAGYRVLGDAYMRQGEYLQAMEAYNKALTMAKKAKN